MRKLWSRLLVKLGLRKKAKVHYGRAEISLMVGGKRVVIGVFRSITYGPIAPRTDEEARLFRERHCAVCLQVPSPCCGALRNTAHAEGCTHVCTHSYQRFAP